ncbi:SH3 domain-containing protein [Clostridium sp. LY3-2]|uniref:C40 family peptidase n=2 Tax=Clostridium TaxID=1485 RepID=UPI0021524374|nr:SH3 domain-containing C40 family peptidase [Clostridium sp. LY3-2]MCR6513380.1 SH3 domain-containing protein [Clostridium sp. LY3-2]
MKNKKVAAFVLAASTTSGVLLASNSVVANADEVKNKDDNSLIDTQRSIKTGKVVNVTSSLRVREGKSINSKVLGYLKPNEKVKIKEKSGDWYKIEFKNSTGYVSKDYIKEDGASSGNSGSGNSGNSESSLNQKGQVINVTSSLRVRSKASTDSSVIGYLTPNQKFDIVAKSGSFYKIKFDGVTGYVHKDYVKVLGSDSGDQGGGSTSGDTSTDAKRGQVINVTSSLRIRSSASTSSSVVGQLSPNQKFDILGKSGSFYKIKADGTTGYVHKDYVKVLGEDKPDGGGGGDESSTDAKRGKVVNVTSNLRIRSSASTSSSVVGYLLEDETFDILGKSGAWYKIKKNGTTGYIHSDYVKVIGGSDIPDEGQGGGGDESSTDAKRGKVINVTSNLRMRNGPSTSSSVVGYLLNGDTFDILGKSGSWYKIKKDGTTGYISGEYVKVIDGSDVPDDPSGGGGSGEYENQYGKVINVTSSLRLREKPNTSSNVLGYLSPSESVKVQKKEGDWFKVNARGMTGYAHSDYIKLTDGDEGHDGGGGGESSASYDSLYKIISAQIGSPYTWGGKGELLTTASLDRLKRIYPDVAAEGRYNTAAKYVNQGYRAFDCSGLFYWGFNQIGINVGASTYDQINAGREVSVNDARPGDLLFYGNLQHVGMYIGNGQWIEAPYSGAYVRISNVPYNKVTRARRVLN